MFKAKSENIGKLQKWEKWENADFTLKYWILIRMNHISVIFIKFWVIQSCLKQNPTSWESCKNGKNGKKPISSSNLGFDQNESHFRDFHQILGKTVLFKAKSSKLGKFQNMEKMEKRRYHPQMLDSDQSESHFHEFHPIWGNTVVFKAKSVELGKLQNMGKMEKCRFRPQILDLIGTNHISVIFIKFWVS
jgi:hypothetical protein